MKWDASELIKQIQVNYSNNTNMLLLAKEESNEKENN